MTPLAYFGIESSGVTIAIDLIIVFGVLLYLALIYWTYVDARSRIVDPTLVGSAVAVSLFPFVGTLLYLILRPSESIEDARERELELETTRLRLHQLESSLCPHCDYPVESDFIRCPSCLRRLKERCKNCSRPLDRAWTICPYCETEVAERASAGRRSGSRRGSRSRPALERELGGKAAGADQGAGAAERPSSEKRSGSGERPASPTAPVKERRRPVPAAGSEQGRADGRRGRPAAAVAGPDADGRAQTGAAEPASEGRTRASDRSRTASTQR